MHLEATNTYLQNFGERLFLGFSPTSTGAAENNPKLIPKEQYVKHMKMMVAPATGPRLDFLLDLYVSPSDRDNLAYDSLVAFFNELIALYDYLHTKEESQIEEFGYCLPDEPSDGSDPSEAHEDTFVPLKDMNKLPRPAKKAPKPVEEEEVTHVEPPKQINPNANYTTTFAVPKHKIEDVLPTQSDMDAQLRKDVTDMIEFDKQKSRQTLQICTQVVSSIVCALMKDCHVDVDVSEPLSNRSNWKVDYDRAKSWISSNMPKAADVLLALVRLTISNPLSSNANDMVKKHYQRAAPQPDGVDMEKSTLWSPTMIWTMHQYYTLKGINAFKLLYSSTTHGRSFNRFIHHVVGYKAETMFIITTTKGEIFGAFVATPWEMSSSYWSNSNCYLFGVSPVLSIRHATSNAQPNYCYFFTNKKSFTGKPVGIGFGGTPGNFRLWIDEDLLTGTIRTMDPSYENGLISPNPVFDIASIEVWGSCTEYAQQQLIRERKLRDKDAERARKAIAKDGWNEGADKFIMDLVGKTGHSDGIYEAIARERREAKEREAQLAAMREKMESESKS